MIRFPPEFKALAGFPGYFWNSQDQQLYTMKIAGVLRPLKLQKTIWSYGKLVSVQPNYQISRNGRRFTLTMRDIQRLIENPHTIPVRD